MEYEPFETAFEDLTSADLSKLKNISEGWYIEYKELFPNNKQIAKSISAFANTYGGYLFFGIQEHSNTNPIAGSFPGLSAEDSESAEMRIRQSASEHISPTPYFDLKLITGPCNEIGLPANRTIILVRVFESHSTPHIHSSGVIYKRVGSSSEPITITSHSEVNDLYKRPEKVDRFWNSWIDNVPDLFSSDKNTSYIRLLLTADLKNSVEKWPSISANEFISIINSHEGRQSFIKFDNIYYEPNQYIARHVENNSIISPLLTWTLSTDFRSEILLPFRYWTIDQIKADRRPIAAFERLNAFISYLHTADRYNTKIIDMNQSFLSMLCFVEIQNKLANHFKWKGDLYARMEVHNTMGAVPFLDTSFFMNQVADTGIPLILRQYLSFPNKRGSNGFISYSGAMPTNTDGSPNHQTKTQLDSLMLFEMLCNCVGLNSGWSKPDSIDEYFIFSEIVSAAKKAQTLNNEL